MSSKSESKSVAATASSVKMFAKLESQMKEVANYENNLKQLSQDILGKEFDEEDRKIVKIKLDEVILLKNQLSKELNHKQNIYHNQIKSMENKLDQRKIKLDSLSKKTNVFQQFPDMLDYFARKQTTLNTTLEKVKNKLTN